MVRGSAYATNSAVRAVILPLVFVVQKNAFGAPIGAEGDTAGPTGLRHVLDLLTPFTLDRLDRTSIQRMRLFAIGFVLVLGLVVTEATGEELSATGGKENGFAFVMRASFVVLRHFILSFDCFI